MEAPSQIDIAEMKARGYDPSTIADEWRRGIPPICEAIEAAFAGVTLGRGVGLTEAQGLDDYADAATLAACRARDEKTDWHRIPAKALNQCYRSLSFFDALGMRFHLPAYLLADLRGEYEEGVVSCLAYASASPERFGRLSLDQRAAVRRYLRHVADNPGHEHNRAEILKALAEFWTEQTRAEAILSKPASSSSKVRPHRQTLRERQNRREAKATGWEE